MVGLMRKEHERATSAATPSDAVAAPAESSTPSTAAKARAGAKAASAKTSSAKAVGAKANGVTTVQADAMGSAVTAAMRPTSRGRQNADAPTPTLRARLAALYADAALASSVASVASTPPTHPTQTPATLAIATTGRPASALAHATPVTATPADDALAAYAATLGAPLSPAKRALLVASLHGFDAQAAARRLTVAQLAEVARGVGPSADGAGATQDEADPEEGGLTLTRLDAMTDETWRAFAQWLLEREGYAVERLTSAAAAPVWRGERRGAGSMIGGTSNGANDPAGASSAVVITSAARLPVGWPLEDEAVRRAASTALSETGAQAILITTASATVGALLEARRLGVRLLDRAALGERLRGLATAYQREQAQAQRETQARAASAVSARERLLTALAAVEVAFVGSGALAAKAVSGRAAVKRAATEAREAQRLASQALLAWETLIGEWQATFGERPARDGSLALLADSATLGELATRGDHLRDALLTAIQRLVTAPADGELGYGAWRQALSEDLLARIQTLRWRVQAVDPDHWQDHAAAHDDDALLEATSATNAATHAAARAQQAYAQLAERVGLG